MSANLLENISVSDMNRKNILKALYALKNIVFAEKIVAKICRKKNVRFNNADGRTTTNDENQNFLRVF